MDLTIDSDKVPQSSNWQEFGVPFFIQEAAHSLRLKRESIPAETVAILDAAILRLLSPWIVFDARKGKCRCGGKLTEQPLLFSGAKPVYLCPSCDSVYR